MNNRSRQRGHVVIWVALVGVLLVGIVGLAADTALVMLTRNQLQVAADAASLAGALQVKTATEADVVTAAQNIAALNRAGGKPAELATTDVTIGYFDLYAPDPNNAFTPGGAPPNAVKVVARRTTGSPAGPLPLVFGPALGVASSEVSRTAIAVNGAQIRAGLIVLDPDDSRALALTGNSNITVENGCAVVNSDSSTAVTVNGASATVTADATFVVGGVDPKLSFDRGPAYPGSRPIADPLADLAEPDKSLMTTYATASYSGTVALSPGYYPNGIIATSNAVLNLEAGIYYVDNGIDLGGGAVVNATAGCLFYLHTGGITQKGNNSIQISAPTTGVYKDVAFFSARDNTSPIYLTGTTAQQNSGTFYFPKAPLILDGTSDCIANQIICNTLTMKGNGAIHIQYDGRFMPAGFGILLVR